MLGSIVYLASALSSYCVHTQKPFTTPTPGPQLAPAKALTCPFCGPP